MGYIYIYAYEYIYIHVEQNIEDVLRNIPELESRGHAKGHGLARHCSQEFSRFTARLHSKETITGNHDACTHAPKALEKSSCSPISNYQAIPGHVASIPLATLKLALP